MKRRILARGRRFHMYTYSLTAAGIAIMVQSVLGFALYSSLHHLVWMSAMNRSAMIPFWLYAVVAILALLILVFWYRLIANILYQIEYRKKFLTAVNPSLMPLCRENPIDYEGKIKWCLVDNDDARYAFTWGIKHPKIAVSKGLWETLDEPSLRAVLYHEVAHVLAHDTLQQSLLQALSAALHPLAVSLLYKRYLIRRELLADQFSISACEGDEVPLLTALLAVSKSVVTKEPQVGLTGALHARLDVMESGQLPGWWDVPLRNRMLSTAVAILFTLGEGVLIWCR
ncbi:M56 family metallopeptidase [Ferroacidibacillus organovorans]|uniref:Peptidase M48 domain-containing protein n=1 Tax=Ferroacidibacillus organovorans TaxID=1765683 RepID=A0A1V4EXK5_9BACL|nr:M56 family metallopeptidase [Ferroacidibacillus organovorans]OPG17378.1 hypothetical protein B2M26_01180 [Ferroacidibacillus organovorans]